MQVSDYQKQYQLECINCHRRITFNKTITGCPHCGENILEARYDLRGLDPQRWLQELKGRRAGLWRYHEVLPLLDLNNVVSLGEGGTPLIKSRALAASLGLKHLYIKDERQGPTGSFKDRQATVALSVLRENGIDEIVLASTGNVAISYAAYCVRAGVKLWAFFPSLTPSEKMREAALYGAEVIKITGTYDQTKEVAARFAKAKGIFLDKGIKSVAAIEAMKTMAYEIAEQLGQELESGQRWRAPDWYIQSVSGGMGPIGMGKGFREMYDFGILDSMPAMGLVQSTGCAPMVEAFRNGQSIATPIEVPQTIIATLATGNPGRAYEMLYNYTQQYGGYFIDANDEDAFNAIRTLARNDGLSVEPATGVTFAGLFKMVQGGIIKPDDVVVVNASGHTLPVETRILGEQWQRSVDLAVKSNAPVLPEEGLLSALEQVDALGRRVVIIEDNVDAARLVKRILEAKGGYEVHMADDGARGIEMILRLRPDLVITDLMMPNVDGFTVIDTMKSDPEMRHIPIVVVTAKELTAKERARLSGQIDMLLQKGSVIDDEFVQKLVDNLD